jgi:hypothetical protein
MLIATEHIVYELAGDGHQDAPTQVFEGTGVRRVAEGSSAHVIARADGGLVVLAGGGREPIRTGIDDRIHSILILREHPARVLVGTEPPHVYVAAAEGDTARRVQSFEELECRDDWYTPWGGPAAVRSLARTGDGWAYADIHVGSIMRSADEGESWQPVTPELHVDVHQVATCAADDERVYAQTADAFWISYDRGESWDHRAEDLGERYGRCVTVHPAEPDLLLSTVSDGPHGENVHGQLFRSEDAGRSWRHVADGFPESTEENIDTFHVAFAPGGTAWACVGRTLYIGREQGAEWEAFWQAPHPIVMLSCRRP